jgi:hypothetical protein
MVEWMIWDLERIMVRETLRRARERNETRNAPCCKIEKPDVSI